MKPLLFLMLFVSAISFAQDTPTPQQPNSEASDSGVVKFAEDMVAKADGFASVVRDIIKDQQGTCVMGDCKNSFGVSDLPKGGQFIGFYEDGIGTGFSLITNKGNKVEVFSNYVFGSGIKGGFAFMYDNEKQGYYLFDYNNSIGFSFQPEIKKYGHFRLVNNKPQFAKTIEPNGEDYKCVGGDCYSGYGVYRYGNGDTYAGHFRSGKPNGLGEDWIKKTGRMSWGIFKDGKLEGYGVRVWDEYHYYYGEFKNNKRHGKGVLRTSKDTYKAGIWENDEFVQDSNGKTVTSNATGQNNTVVNTSSPPRVANPLSQDEQDKIIACNGGADCLEALYIAKYNEYNNGAPEAEVLQKTADYLLGQDLLTPKNTFPQMMGCYDVPVKVIDYLPPHLKARIQKEAQGLMVNYENYINSEETKKAIEAKGGKMIKN